MNGNDVTDADRERAAELLAPVGFVFDRGQAEGRIAAALAAERAAERDRWATAVEALAEDLCNDGFTSATWLNRRDVTARLFALAAALGETGGGR